MTTPAPTQDALYRRVLAEASEYLTTFKDHTIEAISVDKPTDITYAIHLAKIVSKLSPIIGNILEYRLTAVLNQKGGWPEGRWMRQDPGFPDTIFAGPLDPTPGIEIKTWFPLATEITARFKDSITHFQFDQTNVAMLAWVPDGIIYGRPKLVDVWVAPARSVALARDLHYHRPPHYLVFEPEDTTERTRNLRQTNTNGYVFQGTEAELAEAEAIVAGWGAEAREFSFLPEYQTKLKQLWGRFHYRLDTNFAKMDRIEHDTLEAFKKRVHATEVRGHTIKQWKAILKAADSPKSVHILEGLLR